jgi:hypothetical protein
MLLKFFVRTLLFDLLLIIIDFNAMVWNFNLYLRRFYFFNILDWRNNLLFWWTALQLLFLSFPWNNCCGKQYVAFITNWVICILLILIIHELLMVRLRFRIMMSLPLALRSVFNSLHVEVFNLLMTVFIFWVMIMINLRRRLFDILILVLVELFLVGLILCIF